MAESQAVKYFYKLSRLRLLTQLKVLALYHHSFRNNSFKKGNIEENSLSETELWLDLASLTSFLILSSFLEIGFQGKNQHASKNLKNKTKCCIMVVGIRTGKDVYQIQSNTVVPLLSQLVKHYLY